MHLRRYFNRYRNSYIRRNISTLKCKKINSLKFNQKHKIIFKFYKAIIYAFCTFGIDLAPKDKDVHSKFRVKNILHLLIVTLMHAFFIYRIFVLTFRVEHVKEYTEKSAALLAIREVIVLLIWYSVHYYRKRIIKVFLSLYHLSSLLQSSEVKKLKNIFFVVLIFIYATPLIISAVMTSVLSKEDAQMYVYMTALNLETNYYTYHLSFILYLIYNYYLLILPALVSAIYIFVCLYTRRILAYCTLRLSKCEKYDFEMENAIDSMMKVLSFIETVEKALSVCISLALCLNLALSFTCFAYALGYYNISVSLTSGSIYWVSSNLSLFIAVVWLASDVNIKSSRLGRTFIGTVSSFEVDKGMSPAYMLTKFMQFHVIPLTIGQMFQFSRGIIFSALGSMLTYGLLILQTKWIV